MLADAEEKREFLGALGLGETGLDRVIRAGYALLDLITFFTAGPKEAHAWTVRAAPRRRRPPASSTAISRRASSAPKRSPTRISSPAAASRAPRKPARCGSKAPTTSCRTATSSISGSTCNTGRRCTGPARAGPVAWRYLTGITFSAALMMSSSPCSPQYAPRFLASLLILSEYMIGGSLSFV